MNYQWRKNDSAAAPPGGLRAGLVPLNRIRSHDHNVRRDLGDLRELAEAITRHGVITPVVLERRGEMFRIRDGHRRVAAATIAGLTRIPALIHGRALDDAEWVVNSVQANEQRRGLTPSERRDTIQRLRDEGFTWEQIAAEFGRSKATVQRWHAGTAAGASSSTPGAVLRIGDLLVPVPPQRRSAAARMAAAGVARLHVPEESP